MNDKGSSYVRRKRKESQFTQLSNDMLRDDRISWKARGLLSYMLSMPDDWVFYETELVKHSLKDGITSLRSAMKELKLAGYVCKEAIKGEDGKIIKWVTYVDEEPVHIIGKLQSGKSTIKDEQSVEDSTLLIPINTNNDNTNNNKVIKKTSRHNFTVDDMNNANLLFDWILDNNPSAKKPNLESWANEFRLMRTQDGRTNEQIVFLIDWSQRDKFWKSNILSPSKLRKQFDALIVKVKSEKENKTNYNNQAELKPWEVAAYGQEPGRTSYDDDRSVVQQQIKIEQPKFNI